MLADDADDESVDHLPDDLGETNERDRDPERDRWATFWKEYEVATLDRRLAVAHEVVEEGDDVDGELAFDLVDGVAAACQEGGRIRELEELINHIEQRDPEVFAEESSWFYSWRVENALLSGGDAKTPLLALAAEADRGIDQFFRLVDRLLYHGREPELREALEIAWPPVRDSDDIMEHGKVELRDLALYLLLLDQLDRNTDLAHDDVDFLKATEPYRLTEGHPWWRDIIDLRTGRRLPKWERIDFALNNDPEAYEQAMFVLSVQFAIELERQHGWQRCRAELARDEAFSFLLQRGRQKRKRARGKNKPRASVSPFSSLITPESLDEFMAGNLDIIGARPYRAACLAKALAFLLSFLVNQGLLDAGEARHLEDELGKRCAPLGRVLDRFVVDPVLIQDVRNSLHGEIAAAVAAAP
jgi:hypothetical protein